LSKILYGYKKEVLYNVFYQ